MLYMLLALPAGQGTPGMAMPAMTASGAASSFPALALVLALFTLGYLLWTTDRLATRARARTAAAAIPQTQHRALITVPAAPSAGPASRTGTPGATGAPAPPTPAGHPLLAATFADCSKIMMSIAMGYMLITML